jgi:hypothetical protein
MTLLLLERAFDGRTLFPSHTLGTGTFVFAFETVVDRAALAVFEGVEAFCEDAPAFVLKNGDIREWRLTKDTGFAFKGPSLRSKVWSLRRERHDSPVIVVTLMPAPPLTVSDLELAAAGTVDGTPVTHSSLPTDSGPSFAFELNLRTPRGKRWELYRNRSDATMLVVRIV